MDASSLCVATGHTNIVHDAQMCYYGKTLATCSSDGSIRVFRVEKETYVPTAEIKTHKSPVFEVSWAHPKFGTFLASCGYDQTVQVHHETSPGVWETVYVYQHASSVNSVAWAPHEAGLVLAAGSGDDSVSVHAMNAEGVWAVQSVSAHASGVNAVSWAPASPGANLSEPILSSGGCDKKVALWKYSVDANEITPIGTLPHQHGHWVRDVAWSPALGVDSVSLASASQDGGVLIHFAKSLSAPISSWETRQLPKQGTDVVWRVSWSMTGDILAVSQGDDTVTLWEETIDGTWKCVETRAA